MTSSSSEFIGQRLKDRYVLTLLLDEGGMGKVWLADDQDLGRQVVIKMPHAELLRQEDFVTRFEREIRSLVTLELPGVVRVLDVGRHEETPFFVLQFLGGGNLKQVLEARRRADGEVDPQTPSEVSRWLLPLARILDRVHMRGVVHRDVKPANVLFDEHGELYLADFGIAKALGAEDTGLTMTGQTPGTPRYMAPEACSTVPLGADYDQYALGVMAFEAMSRELPHDGGTPIALLTNRRTTAPRHLHRIAPSVPAAVSRVVQKCLSQDPKDRFKTCSEFAEAFSRAASMPAAEPRRRGALLAGVAGVLVLVVGALIWKFGGSGDESSTPQVADPSAQSPSGSSPSGDPDTTPAGAVDAATQVRALLATADSQRRAEEWTAALAALDEAAGLGELAEETAEARALLLYDRAQSEFADGQGDLDQALRSVQESLSARQGFAATNLEKRVEMMIRQRLRSAPSEISPPPGTWHTSPEVELSARVPASVQSFLVEGQEWAAQDGVVQGRWTASGDGPHTIRATVRGISGLEEGPLDVWTIQVDTQPARMQITSPSEGDAGWAMVGGERTFLTRAKVLALAGQVLDGETLRIDGAEVDVQASGRFEHSIPLTTEGLQGIELMAEDAAGNQTPWALLLLVDRSPPSLGLEQPAEGQTQVLEGATTFSGTVSDGDNPPRAPRVQVDGVEARVEDGAWTLSLDLVAGRQQPIEVVATDAAGNSAKLSRRLQVVPPEPTGSIEGVEGLSFLRINPATQREEYLHEQTGIEFVLLPGGAFTMGSPPDEPGREEDEVQREVRLSPFLMAKTELSQEQWMSLGATLPAKLRKPRWSFPGPRRPAENISWLDCQIWFEQTRPPLTFPTEAQWEYACRAGTTTAYASGSSISRQQAQFQGGEDVARETVEVGSFPPNAFGLHDLHGNVYEWCEDEYREYVPTPALDPRVTRGSSEERILRGGSWSLGDASLRSAHRGLRTPGYAFSYIGVRPVLLLQD